MAGLAGTAARDQAGEELTQLRKVAAGIIAEIQRFGSDAVDLHTRVNANADGHFEAGDAAEVATLLTERTAIIAAANALPS